MKKSVLFFIVFNMILTINLSANDTVFYGKASWYGEKFHGRRTANGEIYDMNKLTAAHKTLPFGTILKVTNMANGKKIQVKVNDRGPFVQGRVLDLSKKAAEELGYKKSGVTNIKAEIVFLPNKSQRDFDFQDEVIDPANKQKDKKEAVDSKDEKNDSKTEDNIENDNIDQIIDSLKTDLTNGTDESVSDKKEAMKNGGLKEKDPVKEEKNSGEEIKIEKDSEIDKNSGEQKFEQKTGQIFVIQFGAFTTKEKAEQFYKSLQGKGIEAYITSVERDSLVLYKVRDKVIYKDLEKVKKKVNEFNGMGLKCFVVGKFFFGS